MQLNTMLFGSGSGVVQCVGNDVGHPLCTFAVGMDTVVYHLIAIVLHQGVQVDYLQTILTGNFLLDRDNLVGDYLVIDVPT